MDTPKRLLEAIKFFSEYENCRQYMISVRWADGIVRCPTCGSDKVLYMEKSKLYNCKGSKHPRQKFSLKVGTIYEDSAIGLEKWLPATWLLSNCKNGISSYELARALGVTQKSAWHMLHRIRKAMEVTGDAPMGGEGKTVVTDETFIGGKVENMHYKRLQKQKKQVRPERVQRYNDVYGNKIAVEGIFDKETRELRAKVVPNVKRKTLQKEILASVVWGSTMHTDSASVHANLHEKFVQKTVNHAVQYVREEVTTNALENFWSLLKRNLNGTYVAVEPFHLDRYLAEQVFRFNTSKSMNDAARFRKALSQIVGKRLTYAEVTGKVAERA